MSGAVTFQHVVVGGGPIGASAARHLVEAGSRVMLLAPRDPEHAVPGSGLPSSHADLSRITRRLDVSPVWARLAVEAAGRYRSLEQESGVPFFTESGCLTVIEGQDYQAQAQHAAFEQVASELHIPFARLSGCELAEKFPGLQVAPGTTVLHEEAGAGWIDPRAYVRAQIAVGTSHGLEVRYEPMSEADVTSDPIALITRSGERITGQRVMFAMGPYSAFDLPLVDSQELVIYARTVVHVRLSNEQLRDLGPLPSMIVRGTSVEKNCYILPPIRYPDGHWYIKIGGGPRAQSIATREELAEWFEGAGDPMVGSALQERLEELLPVTRGAVGTTQACAVTATESALPRMAELSGSTILVTGGNGHAAKSGDEIGRLAAHLVLGRDEWDTGYPAEIFAD